MGSVAYRKAASDANTHFLSVAHDQTLELSPGLDGSHSSISWTLAERDDEPSALAASVCVVLKDAQKDLQSTS
jgi:hypothetical protein